MSEKAEQRTWPKLSLLDVMRPAPGWKATDAVLSTYSLDLVVLVSALLALSGRDQLDGGGTKVALATAIDQFRDRLTVVMQRGRLTTAPRGPTVLALLDRFVSEVERDQRSDSWHAKAALVRFIPVSADGQESDVEWRLWIGSRNFSRDMSWDTGLVLTGIVGPKGQLIPGLVELADALFTEAGWQPKRRNTLLTELQRVDWAIPRDVTINRIVWLDGRQHWRPALPAEADTVTVITPFFDRYALDAMKAAAGEASDRTLITTPAELDRRMGGGDLRGWQAHCLEAAEQAQTAVDEPDEGDSQLLGSPKEDEEEPIGLHAKMIAARAGDRVTLYMGSANATRRAWSGNAEIVVELEGGQALWEGIDEIMRYASPAQPAELEFTEADHVRHALEAVRNAVCTLPFRQTLTGNEVELRTSGDVSWVLCVPGNEKEAPVITLELAPLHGDYQVWDTRKRAMRWRQGEDTLGGETEFVRFRLSCPDPAAQSGEAERTCLSWLQRVPLEPAPGIARDRRILTGYLSPREFIRWLKGLLEGFDSDDVPWNAPKAAATASGKGRLAETSVPTVESLLKAWLRDDAAVEEVARAVDRYIDAADLRRRYGGDSDSEDIALLDEFRQLIAQMQSVLKEKMRR